MSDLLFVTPNERGTARSLSAVSQALQARVPNRHTVTDLHDKAATKVAVNNYMTGADCVFYFGHGTQGHLGLATPLIDVNNARDTLVVFGIACKAGAGLGPTVWDDASSGGFIGFDQTLIHPRRSPQRANTAYENALNDFVQGAALSSVRDAVRDELLDAANDYLAAPHRYRLHAVDALLVFASLRSNTVALVLEGNQGAVI